MIVYGYDKLGVSTGPVAARLSPARPKNEDGTWNYIFPARTTSVEPPAAGNDESAIWDETSKAWRLVADFRGKSMYATADGSPAIVQALGAIPDGYTLEARPGPAYSWQNGAWQVDLAAYRVWACDKVDAEAETLRNTVATAGSAQAMVYIEKERQARAYLAATDPVESDYPNLVAEVGINGATVRAVAETIIRFAEAWRAWGAQVEKIRLGTKGDIRKAGYVVVIDGILSALSWPAVPNVE